MNDLPDFDNPVEPNDEFINFNHVTKNVMDEFLKRHSIKRYISVLDQVAVTRPNELLSNARDSIIDGFMYYN